MVTETLTRPEPKLLGAPKQPEEKLKLGEQSATDVKLGGYYVFTPPPSAVKGYADRDQWYGQKHLREFNDAMIDGQVIKINPKSVTVKNVTEGEWNYGHVYKVPKDARATKDLSDLMAKQVKAFKPVDVNQPTIKRKPSQAAPKGEWGTYYVQKRTGWEGGKPTPEFEKVKGRKLTVPGYEDYDLFLTGKSGHWEVSEGKSGYSLSVYGDTVTAAIAKAKEKLDAIGGKSKLDFYIESATKEHGVSPRHRTETKPPEIKLLAAPKAEPKPTAEAKEPWKMTNEQWTNTIKQARSDAVKAGDWATSDKITQSFIDSAYGQDMTGTTTSVNSAHRFAIKRALSEGKPVPAEVLKDYPELANIRPISKQSAANAQRMAKERETEAFKTAEAKFAEEAASTETIAEREARRRLETKTTPKAEAPAKAEPKAETKPKETPEWAERHAYASSKDAFGHLVTYKTKAQAEKGAAALNRHFPFYETEVYERYPGTWGVKYRKSPGTLTKEAKAETKVKEEPKPHKEIAILQPKPGAKQSNRAIAIDRSLLAKQVVAVDDPRWLKRPNRFDVRGVDTPSSHRIIPGVAYTDKGAERLARRHHKGWRRVKFT